MKPKLLNRFSPLSTLRKRILATLIFCAAASTLPIFADTITSGFKMKPEWRVGAEFAPAGVVPTNSFIKGHNSLDKKITSSFAGGLNVGFKFNPQSRQGLLYKGLYQGIGFDVRSFTPGGLLGNPVSLHAYQGAPFVTFNNRLSLGYEWKFGAAFGWKAYDSQSDDNNAPVSTKVTARMGLGLKLQYALSDRWSLALGVEGNHFSNGNTSWPNAGVNTLGATIGIAYTFNPQHPVATCPTALSEEANAKRWIFDIMAFAAARKRAIRLPEPYDPVVCPGRFGVVGLRFSPLRKFNRWFAAGPTLDMQWDESADLASYWVEGTSGETIRFVRPPFKKQISVGLAGNAELTMPIFTLNAGLGYEVINPKGDKRFYQSLTLKTFVTDKIYLNVGYRLANFEDPQNLMLGVGFRL
ncbi:MAG: acyloxyacyl hydrolase [Muribaculaceae bacterium]|nr:acyloxyacyl hydrolase [Muribaculaceae bacterium]